MMGELAIPDSEVTAVVLAGGMSRRLGRNKALEPFEGETLIRRVIGRMRQVSSRIVVVVNNQSRVAELSLPEDVRAVVDEYPSSGSLGGIFSGLHAASTEWAVFCACDMPFLDPDLYAMLLSNRAGFDAVVPVLGGRPEPIHAAYSRRCLKPIRSKILADDLKIAGFYDDVAVRYVEEDEIRAIDPRLLSFFNINTESDLRAASALAEKEALPCA